MSVWSPNLFTVCLVFFCVWLIVFDCDDNLDVIIRSDGDKATNYFMF